ncbi:MAG TPA: lytic transglycosylase domain-containing protein [Candidatus Binatia bacterium]|nr:lytic transglycosylase domain-containing protein [Candidatus Binatia bacterium]
MPGLRSLLAVAAIVTGCGGFRTPAPPPAPAPTAAVTADTPARLPCPRDERIEEWERRLREDPWLRESLARGEQYLPRLRAIMERHGLPPSLALLPAVESGFDPRARGRYGELGLWQLRRPTARRFGLVVTVHRDDRLEPERATEAAARYLAALHERYGEWPLALAAYNAGERRIDRALAREPDATFWDLADHGRLPRTSRDFVTRFMALVQLAEPATC